MSDADMEYEVIHDLYITLQSELIALRREAIDERQQKVFRLLIIFVRREMRLTNFKDPQAVEALRDHLRKTLNSLNDRGRKVPGSPPPQEVNPGTL